jgi:hypothetical protein
MIQIKTDIDSRLICQPLTKYVDNKIGYKKKT